MKRLSFLLALLLSLQTFAGTETDLNSTIDEIHITSLSLQNRIKALQYEIVSLEKVKKDLKEIGPNSKMAVNIDEIKLTTLMLKKQIKELQYDIVTLERVTKGLKNLE